MSSSQDDLSTLPDNELVKLAKHENADAFAELFQRYKRSVHRFLIGLVSNEEEAADLMQKAFLNAWDKLFSLHDESRFKSWLFMIARNLAYDYKRLTKNTSQSLERLMEHFEPANGINFEDDIAAKELVKLAFAELPPQYRDCLLLLKSGFPRDEIADMLNIGEASVPTYICTARKLFRQAYYRLKAETEVAKKESGSL